MGKLNKFQTQDFIGFKPGVSQKNHLGAFYALAPQKATNIMVQLLAYSYGASLDSMLSQFPTKEFDTDDEYTWDVIASSRRNIPLKEARDLTGPIPASGVVGANTTPFYLVFAEDYFADGEVIVGNLNEVYLFRILGDAKREGTDAVYKVELMGGNTTGVPVERLQSGERFSVEYAPVESELSRKVGDIRMSTPVSMRNEFTTIRKQAKVSGAMLNRKLAIGIPVVKEGADGKYTHSVMDMWMHYVEWEFEKEFSDEKNHLLAYGRSNRTSNGEYLNIGKSGNAIRQGDGLYAQMEVANTIYYGNFSLKLLEDALHTLSVNKLGLGNRKFVVKTGEMGAIAFHKAVLQEISGWQAFHFGEGVIGKTSSKLHSNAMKAGFQFTEYQAPNGVTVVLDVDPFYDDPIRNKILHSKGGVAMSYRFDIMDIGTMDQPNIFKVGVKGTPEYRGYQWGLRNPFTGQIGNPHMSFDEDSAVMHRMATLGICVLDPTRTLSLVPVELAE